MEHFVFRPINLADIAAAVRKNTTELRLTTGPDGPDGPSGEGGVVAVDTPDLTVAERAALRALFTNRGYVEDPTVEVDLA